MMTVALIIIYQNKKMKFYSLLAVVALSSSKLTQEHTESMV